MIKAVCADLRTIQLGMQLGKLGKLGMIFPTTPTGTRCSRQQRAQSSWERFSQLPSKKYAWAFRTTQKPVGKEFSHFASPNLLSCNAINHLQRVLSCGGETTPFGGGGSQRLRLAPTPLPVGPGGFARPPPNQG